ncbi:sensor histidine kinase [Micromonospora sp. NPDC000089]|uniref:sensor histidine kinase n=1 Tax=unclassified Micromonospora TaxID=2617518 RepID=UPI0036938592
MCLSGFRTRLLADGAIAGVILTVALVALLASARGPVATAVGVALAVAQAGCPFWIARRPEYALAVAVAAGVGLEAICPQLGWLGLVAVPLSYYARLRPPRVSVPVLALLVAPTPWKLVTGGWRDLLLAVTGVSLGWALGELQRGAVQRREARRRQIVARERERISRELHDVVAHHVSVIAVQAAAAEDVFDLRPERARAALGAIGTAARATLTELRSVLHTLTADDDPTAPQPGLAELDALTDAVRDAGLRVDLHRDGLTSALPAGVELSAYRIVQESLTNALRHGRARHADVTIRYTDQTLRVEVVDDGTGPPRRLTARDGHGIPGMRERARLLGGELAAGPLPGGGFRVAARLPVREGR